MSVFERSVSNRKRSLYSCLESSTRSRICYKITIISFFTFQLRTLVFAGVFSPIKLAHSWWPVHSFHSALRTAWNSDRKVFFFKKRTAPIPLGGGPLVRFWNAPTVITGTHSAAAHAIRCRQLTFYCKSALTELVYQNKYLIFVGIKNAV